MTPLHVFALCVLLVAPQPPKFNPDKLPYRAPWGPLTVLVEKTGPGDWDPQRAQILDGAGQVLREVDDQRIMDVTFPDISGKGTQDLHINTFSGGAHCCFRDYFFSQEGGLKNILIFDSRDGGINGIKDINGDGRPDIIATSDVLDYFDGLPHVASPWMPMIIVWNGQAYGDQTAKYPSRSRAQAEDYRKQLQKGLRAKGDFAETTRRMAAAGWYANAFVAGEGPAAREGVLKIAPPSTRAWFVQNEAQLRNLAGTSRSKISTSQEKVLKPPAE